LLLIFSNLILDSGFVYCAAEDSKDLAARMSALELGMFVFPFACPPSLTLSIFLCGSVAQTRMLKLQLVRKERELEESKRELEQKNLKNLELEESKRELEQKNLEFRTYTCLSPIFLSSFFDLSF